MCTKIDMRVIRFKKKTLSQVGETEKSMIRQSIPNFHELCVPHSVCVGTYVMWQPRL